MPGLSHEWDFLARGFRAVAGLDEAGRGAWAGPVVAGAVVLSLERPDLLVALDGVRDSKLCSPDERDVLYLAVWEAARATAVGVVSAQEIDELNIVRATQLAMTRALEALPVRPEGLLIDGRRMSLPGVGLPQRSLAAGELASLSIAAASIIAKVTRDQMMIELDGEYPGYGFARHKGYGTPEHIRALSERGPCPAHRRSFAPVQLSLMDRFLDEDRPGT